MKSQTIKTIKLAKGMMIFIIPFLFISIFLNTERETLDESKRYYLTNQEGINNETWKQIETLQETNIPSTEQLLSLSHLYFQAVRENANTSYFENIEEILKILDQQQGDDSFQDALRAQILLAKHDFKASKNIAENIVIKNPHIAEYKGILFDSLIELGEYEYAEQVLQEMIDIKPNANTFTRVAYLREIYGDLEGAIEIMEKAVLSGSIYIENQAWNYSELGRLWNGIDEEKSLISYQRSKETLPNFAFAEIGIAKHALKKGDDIKALKILDEALTRFPLPEIATLIGDIYEKNGDKEKSEIYYRIVEIGYESIRQAGTNTDLELSQFLLERKRDLEKALQLAKKAYEDRPNIFTAGNLARGYYLKGEFKLAEKFSTESQTTGSKNSELMYHYQMIMWTAHKQKESIIYLKKIQEQNILNVVNQKNLDLLLKTIAAQQ
jgi:tetratricopeptide (TPR) repeat protein